MSVGRQSNVTAFAPVSCIVGAPRRPEVPVSGQPAMLSRAEPPPVAVLLSTFNGETYLAAQLQSLVGQTHGNWTLHWRDDGSTDGTEPILREFAAGPGAGRCVPCPGGERLNVVGSFLTLLRQAVSGPAMAFAFSDQDDIWLPEKLARGVAALAAIPDHVPALYCAGHIAVDGQLRPIGVSPPVRRQPGFPAALTQNIVQGCTMMMNRRAAQLVAASRPPPITWHDWWSYIVVSAAGGEVLVDPTPTILYRQHTANQIGSAGNFWQRGLAVIRRGRRPFVSMLRNHIRALRQDPHLLTSASREQLTVIARGMEGGVRARIAALRLAGFKRQTWQETLVFRLWFVLG